MVDNITVERHKIFACSLYRFLAILKSVKSFLDIVQKEPPYLVYKWEVERSHNKEASLHSETCTEWGIETQRSTGRLQLPSVEVNIYEGPDWRIEYLGIQITIK